MDNQFGGLRAPSGTETWEARKNPISLTSLSKKLCERLSAYRELIQEAPLQVAGRGSTFLWAMDERGQIWLAVEELAESPESPHPGYPLPRGLLNLPPGKKNEPAPRLKKLGHPTLLSSGQARIAGELYLDFEDGIIGNELVWWFNVNSGRYCRGREPTPYQIKNTAVRFADFGLKVVIDDMS